MKDLIDSIIQFILILALIAGLWTITEKLINIEPVEIEEATGAR